jgi:hypothetical protein
MQTAGARILADHEPQGASQDDPRRSSPNGPAAVPGGGPAGMSREAVLLQWERKIEEAERGPRNLERSGEGLEGTQPSAGRFERSGDVVEVPGPSQGRVERSRDERRSSPHDAGRSGGAAPLADDAAHGAPRRSHRRAGSAGPATERRTITITGRPAPARRRRSVVENQLAQPDRIALWAFLLGLFLVAVAAGTAHA